MAEATDYYSQTEAALGERIAAEVENTVKAILAQPLLWRLRRDGLRRVNLPGFPYYLSYVARGERVYAVALAHSARSPGYFLDRLDATSEDED